MSRVSTYSFTLLHQPFTDTHTHWCSTVCPECSRTPLHCYISHSQTHSLVFNGMSRVFTYSFTLLHQPFTDTLIGIQRYVQSVHVLLYTATSAIHRHTHSLVFNSMSRVFMFSLRLLHQPFPDTLTHRCSTVCPECSCTP